MPSKANANDNTVCPSRKFHGKKNSDMKWQDCLNNIRHADILFSYTEFYCNLLPNTDTGVSAIN